MTTADPTPAAPEPSLLDKARAVTAKVGRLSRDFAGAHRLAHQAQVREALLRTELTVALHESLLVRAEAEARLRGQAVTAYRLGAGERPLRRHNRASQLIDRILARLGPVGQAVVIARSGVWRGKGGALARAFQMLAYALRGADPKAAAPGVFDQAWYLAAYPDVARRRMPPLVHYLIAGGREGRAPALLFHDESYRRENALELAQTSLTALEHYVRSGAVHGRNPHPLFDIAHYLAQGPDLAPGEDPTAHYLREGGRLGLSPSPLFDPAWYGEQAPYSLGGPALVHYLAEGWLKGYSPHPLFDSAWYLEHWPDVTGTGVPPLLHFATVGAFEGRSPSPWFDLNHYREERGAALAPGVNPLVDYLQGGAWATAEAREGFPTAAYLASRPDVVRAGVTPLEHWARRGGH